MAEIESVYGKQTFGHMSEDAEEKGQTRQIFHAHAHRCGQRVLTDQSVLSLTWPLYQQVGSFCILSS